MQAAKDVFSYRRYWAARFGTAPLLPTSRAEMEALGSDSCDIIIVTGDAYVHPGRLLEAQGFRVGIIARPDWHSTAAFRALGRPRRQYGFDGQPLYGRAALALRRSHTPGGEGGKRSISCLNLRYGKT